jgi:DNA-directed RNA polymerase subunit F
LKGDKEVVLKAVKQAGLSLEHADEILKGDKEVVLAAVKQSGFNLEYADKKLKADKEVVLEAVKNDWAAYKYADLKLQDDKDIKFILEKDEGYINENKKQSIILQLKTFFDDLIENNKDFFAERNTFKVRPGISYDKFYLDSIDGSYDMSLQGLIHHYMWEKKLYHLFLNEDEIKNCAAVIENNPEYIYGPDDDPSQNMLDEIQYQTIVFVGKKLIDLGFDVKDTFNEYIE